MQELTRLLDVSGATVRRDLRILDEQGLLRRTHGGAVTGAPGMELPMHHRAGQREAEKHRIASAAAALVPDSAVVGMSGGTSVTEVARVLARRSGLTIVTNAVNIAADLVGRPDIHLVVIGGNARSASCELVGPVAEQTLADYHFDITFTGVDGLTAAEGCTTYDEMEAHTDRAFLRSSARTVVVTDSTKIGKVTFARICPLRDIAVLVTDSDASPDRLHEVRGQGVEVTLA